MATGTIEFPVTAGVPPDGTSGNNAPGFNQIAGTESIKKVMMVAAFDSTVEESLYFTFRMPGDYASDPVVKLTWMANSTATQAALWGARIGALTPNVDTTSALAKTLAAATTVLSYPDLTEARRVCEAVITLANVDSVAAGDLVFLRVYRAATDGTDTMTVDAQLISVTFEYTTASPFATATIMLPLAAAIPSDGTSLNLPPKFVKIQGTETNPKKHFLVAAFPDVNVSNLWWIFRWPDNYASGFSLKLIAMSNGTTGSIWWWANLTAISPGDANTPLEAPTGSADSSLGGIGVTATGARIVEAGAIGIGDLQSAAAGDLMFLRLYRDPSYATDSATQDGELLAAAITYTKT